MNGYHWTPEQDASLEALVALSASEAALCLSRVLGRRLTRNAIIGRRHRLNHPGNKRPPAVPRDSAHPHARTPEQKQRRRELYAARKLGLSADPIPRRKWTPEERETRNAARFARREQRIADGLKTYGPMVMPPTLAPINGKARHMKPRLWKTRHASPVAYAGEPITVLQFTSRRCKYAVTETKPFLFCGAPSDGPWCPHHHSIVYRPL